ncbi:MAG: diguanylate cyclase [Sphingomonas sp.]|nr:MAG: diguanylate cyclase [Sphingomonas sp.]
MPVLKLYRRLQRGSFSILAPALLITFSMLALLAISLWQERRDARARADLASTNLLTALAQTIGGNIQQIDHGLQSTVDALAIPAIWTYPATLRTLVLFAVGRASPYRGRAFVLDSQGRLIAGSNTTLPLGTSFADRRYFTVHRSSRSIGAFLSEPLESRAAGEGRSLVLSRRVTGRNGEFAGVVAATIPLRSIDATMSSVRLGPQSAINLFTLQGTIAVRNPPLARGAPHNIYGSATFTHMLREPVGQFVGTSAVDGQERLYTFLRPAGLPLILDVATSTQEIFASWRIRAGLYGAAVSALCIAVMTLSFLFRRELRRRASSEAELGRLASTDGLTGLLNRRSFDAAIAREWRRSRRTQASLSLVIIDADHFKAFNDLYGHVAGDKVLKAIADVMRGSARRSSDQVARIGGEEFAILLPDTEGRDAWHYAERVRRAVSDLKIPHRGNGEGWVTISIGVTCSVTIDADDVEAFMNAGDAALYLAKNAGRNRVVDTSA